MSECPFYNEERRISESRELRADRQVHATVTRVHWCSHKHSPVPKGIIFGNKLLSCGGSLAKCQVPVEKRGDFDS